MTHKTTLHELGLEYDAAAAKLEAHAAKLRKKIETLRGDALKKAERRLLLILGDARRCRTTAKELKSYYEKEPIR